MNVLGFDPGYARLGWAVLSTRKLSSVNEGDFEISHKKEERSRLTDLSLLDCGLFETSMKDKEPFRFKLLYEHISLLIVKYKPSIIGFESLFFNKNKKTAEGVYRVQGILLALAGQNNCPVIELSPPAIKKIITQSGSASKKDIMNMVSRLLSLEVKIEQDDTADAVACAFAVFMKYNSQKTLENRVQVN